MDTDPATLHVLFLLLPEAMQGSLHSALDVLRMAEGLQKLQRRTTRPGLSWEFVTPQGVVPPAPPSLAGAWRREPLAPPRPERTVMLVPGVYALNAPHLGKLAAGSALDAVRRHASAGGWIASCYNGIAFPARLGLLDGARIAAPWPYHSWLQRSFPRCDFGGDEPVALHGRVFSTVSVALQTECMIAVLARLFDADLAQACAHVLLHQAQRQRLVPGLAQQQWLAPTTDSPVFRAIQWLQDHLDQPYRLAPLAREAAVSERTLLRHFRSVVGMSPLDYLHRLRLERAKMLLEVSLHDIHAIAQSCGYGSAAAFRRMFRALAGMTPGQYRSRFQLRAKRPRWKVEAIRDGGGGE